MPLFFHTHDWYVVDTSDTERVGGVIDHGLIKYIIHRVLRGKVPVLKM